MKYNKLRAMFIGMFAAAMERNKNLSKEDQINSANAQMSKSHLRHVNLTSSPMYFPTRSQKIKSKIRKRRLKCS